MFFLCKAVDFGDKRQALQAYILLVHCCQNISEVSMLEYEQVFVALKSMHLDNCKTLIFGWYFYLVLLAI